MSKTKILIEGLYFGEGPRWHEGRLWFSDFYDQAVKSVSEAGDPQIELELDDRPSGLGWLPDGRLLLVSMRQRKLRRLDPEGLVDHADISDLTVHLCNDMVVDAHGRAYVGNFGFDLDAELRERGGDLFNDAPTANLVRVDADGAVHRAASGMHFPNGSVITPDGRTLIVAETIATRLTAFTIAEDGRLDDRRVWAELTDVAPDGICLDADGQIWVANALANECVRVAEGGEVTDRVETSQLCFACMLGGDDGCTLFCVTAAHSDAEKAAQARTGKIEMIRVSTPHAGWP